MHIVEQTSDRLVLRQPPVFNYILAPLLLAFALVAVVLTVTSAASPKSFLNVWVGVAIAAGLAVAAVLALLFAAATRVTLDRPTDSLRIERHSCLTHSERTESLANVTGAELEESYMGRQWVYRVVVRLTDGTVLPLYRAYDNFGVAGKRAAVAAIRDFLARGTYNG
jgi:hypothetical protein